MKLAKKVLMSLLVMSLLTPTVFAAEGITAKGEVDQITSDIEYTEEIEPIGSVREDINNEDYYGEKVDFSIVKNNIKLTVERIKTDGYRIRILYSIQKVDGTPFTVDDDNISIEGINLVSEVEMLLEKEIENCESIEEYIKTMAKYYPEYEKAINEDGTVNKEALQNIDHGSGKGMSYNSNPMDKEGNKLYFECEVNQSDKLDNHLIFTVEKLKEEQGKSYDLSFDIKNYLYVNSTKVVDTIENPIDEDEKEYLERLKEEDLESYKEHMERIPKHLLSEKGLNLQISKDRPDCCIDNIGIVDGKLHISMKNLKNINLNLRLVNKQGENLCEQSSGGCEMDVDTGEEKYEQYYIFNVASIDELRNCTFKLEGMETIKTFDISREVNIDLSQLKEKAEIKSFDVSKKLTINDQECTVQNIKLSNMALEINSEIKGDLPKAYFMEIEYPVVNLKMKDGKVISMHIDGSNSHKSKIMYLYSIEDKIDIDDVVSVIVDDQEISLRN